MPSARIYRGAIASPSPPSPASGLRWVGRIMVLYLAEVLTTPSGRSTKGSRPAKRKTKCQPPAFIAARLRLLAHRRPHLGYGGWAASGSLPRRGFDDAFWPFHQGLPPAKRQTKCQMPAFIAARLRLLAHRCPHLGYGGSHHGSLPRRGFDDAF